MIMVKKASIFKVKETGKMLLLLSNLFLLTINNGNLENIFPLFRLLNCLLVITVRMFNPVNVKHVFHNRLYHRIERDA